MDAIIGKKTLTGYHRGTVTYSYGNATEGSRTSYSFEGNVQPAPTKTLEKLELGNRVKDVRAIYTTSNDPALNDLVVIDSITYNVLFIDERNDYGFICDNRMLVCLKQKES